MRLVLASLHLSWLGGATTYLLTVAPVLQRLGHDVTLYSPDPGETAALARERGIRTVDREADLPEACDALLVQDTAMSLDLRSRYRAPQVFVSHGAELDLAVPPQVDGAVAAAVAMNDRAMARLEALAVDVKLARLRQPIDMELFSSRGPPRDRAEDVLLLGNYLAGPRRALVTDVCAELGLRWSQVGFEGTVMANPAEAISRADIVIGYGRSVLEAMAGGRAAYVFDYLGGDGWVTAETYPMLERDGFTGSMSGQVRANGCGATCSRTTPRWARSTRRSSRRITPSGSTRASSRSSSRRSPERPSSGSPAAASSRGWCGCNGMPTGGRRSFGAT